jgi:predicted PurR-regulated permease PerM
MNQPLPTKKQAQVLWFALTALGMAVVIGLIVALVWGVGRVLDLLSPVLWPLAIAGVVACLLSPVVDYFERRKMKRWRAIVLVFALALAVVGGILASVIPQVVVETRQLATKIPEYSQKIKQRANEFIEHPPEILRHLWPAQFSTETDANTDTNAPTGDMATNGVPVTDTTKTDTSAANGKPLAAITGWLGDNLSGLGAWLWGQALKIISGFSLLAGLVLVPVYTFYFLLEKKAIAGRWRDYLPLRDSPAKEEMIFVLHAIGQYLVAYFRGQVLVAICDSILYTIGFLSIGINYAYLLGCAAVLLTMIPFLGAIVVCLAALTLAFVQYGDWLHPLLVLGVFAVVQSLEGLFIQPRIMGNRVGLHPLVIIVAVMTGTTLLGGILGGILAIPLAAALRVIMFRYVWTKGK